MTAYTPQVVVFLGDLLDEGSESNEETFVAYAQRFKAIYESRTVKTSIYVPGDNDVGGEGGDPVTEEKVHRFKDQFPPRQMYIFRGTSGVDISTADETIRNSKSESTTVEIIPVNMLTQKNPSEWADITPVGKNTLRLVVSHLPVMPTQNSQFTVNVLKHLQPSVIFSAHDHKGMDYLGTKKTGRSNGNITFFTQRQSDETKPDEETIILHFAQNEKDLKTPETPREATNEPQDTEDSYIHEIVVPTCSYRMGVKEMAFGIGFINMKAPGSIELHYTNLWLPSRFALLYIYVATLLCCFVLICLGRCQGAKRGRRNSKTGRRSSSGSPSPGSKYSKLV